MSVLWTYFWPCFGAGLLCGVIAGIFAFRAPRVRVKAAQDEIAAALANWSRRRRRALIFGTAATLIAVALWHGPLGGADRFTARVEQDARSVLDHYEMTRVAAHLHHEPLSRRLLLAGPADDFQTTELVRLMSELPGVSEAQWTKEPAGLPLIVEAMAVAIAGFLFGLMLAYLVELRRRHNSQWTW